jgi:hypothetical protein
LALPDVKDFGEVFINSLRLLDETQRTICVWFTWYDEVIDENRDRGN